MRLTTTNNEHTIIIDYSLASALLLAMDIYYETVKAVLEEKQLKGTVEPITTKLFKHMPIVMYVDDKEQAFQLGLVRLGSFGVTLFLKNRDGELNISYDSINLLLKKI